ncbi:MAG: D-tagatose-bisphosphate aldolase, class II, non-catalytic subunit [bacterium]
MSLNSLLALAPARKQGRHAGITSVCSAHPQVIGAALALGRSEGKDVLIEATCNQVNQDGGYIGMTPADFRRFVERIAAVEGFDTSRLLLGGDHLGPNPWKHLPARIAMDKASTMIAAYATAGFKKLHLDTSMSCADDPTPLSDAIIATRSARLAAVAEAHSSGRPPVYVIGTEVPIPGGALEVVEHLTVTTPAAARATVAVHAEAFAREGISDAFGRVIGLVVQPGVEFGNGNVIAYDPAASHDLVAALDTLPMLYEAHSTDYQTPNALAALVKDGFAILKVGPGLTFALREALYGLDHIADALFPTRPAPLRGTMERVMLANPDNWAKYYPGSPQHQYLQRHYSYSDRIRYYWATPEATKAVTDLMDLFGEIAVPEPLISQHLAGSYPDVMAGRVKPTATGLIRAAITRMLVDYSAAAGDLPPPPLT